MTEKVYQKTAGFEKINKTGSLGSKVFSLHDIEEVYTFFEVTSSASHFV